MELGGLCLCGAGHTGKFIVEAKIVLDGDGREGLCFLFDGNPLLGFYRLVEAVRPAATLHFTTGTFIDDGHLVIADDIMDVAFVETIGFEELRNAVDFPGLCFHVASDVSPGRCLPFFC